MTVDRSNAGEFSTTTDTCSDPTVAAGSSLHRGPDLHSRRRRRPDCQPGPSRTTPPAARGRWPCRVVAPRPSGATAGPAPPPGPADHGRELVPGVPDATDYAPSPPRRRAGHRGRRRQVVKGVQATGRAAWPSTAVTWPHRPPPALLGPRPERHRRHPAGGVQRQPDLTGTSTWVNGDLTGPAPPPWPPAPPWTWPPATAGPDP